MAANGGAVSFTDNAEGPLLIAARPTCLRRAVENLAGNAIKYAGGAELSVERRGEERDNPSRGPRPGNTAGAS